MTGYRIESHRTCRRQSAWRWRSTGTWERRMQRRRRDTAPPRSTSCLSAGNAAGLANWTCTGRGRIPPGTPRTRSSQTANMTINKSNKSRTLHRYSVTYYSSTNFFIKLATQTQSKLHTPLTCTTVGYLTVYHSRALFFVFSSLIFFTLTLEFFSLTLGILKMESSSNSRNIYIYNFSNHGVDDTSLKPLLQNFTFRRRWKFRSTDPLPVLS